MQHAGRLGGGVISITTKLPPLPFWKLLHYQLPLPSLISHCLWRGSLSPHCLLGLVLAWSWFFFLSSSTLPPPSSPSFSMPESPPTSSQWRQQAARCLECSKRAMQIPEGRRTPVPPAFEFAAPLTLHSWQPDMLHLHLHLLLLPL